LPIPARRGRPRTAEAIAEAIPKGRDDVGTIEPGKLADLIVVDGDPSRDIRLLGEPERILTVIKDGVVVAGALPQPNVAVSPAEARVRVAG
jgi:cytosine/adenosine deaminase-related metal-dependent hydrolase